MNLRPLAAAAFAVSVILPILAAAPAAAQGECAGMLQQAQQSMAKAGSAAGGDQSGKDRHIRATVLLYEAEELQKAKKDGACQERVKMAREVLAGQPVTEGGAAAGAATPSGPSQREPHAAKAENESKAPPQIHTEPVESWHEGDFKPSPRGPAAGSSGGKAGDKAD